jgi:hypothetical protein
VHKRINFIEQLKAFRVHLSLQSHKQFTLFNPTVLFRAYHQK